MKKTIRTILAIVVLILFGIYIHYFIVGRNGVEYLEHCIGFSDSTTEACMKAARALYYNKTILFK